LISIVTAAYNCEPFIEATYESLRRQTLEDWEWIVVDDCSTDGTLDLLRKLAAVDARIRVVRNYENQGAAKSRNKAIERADGEFIAFIDSDDLWLPNKLAMQVEFMSDEVDFSFTAYEIVTEQGLPTGKNIDSEASGFFDYEDMLAKKATLGCSTVMLRRASVGNLRMPLIRAGQDYAFWLSILRRGTKAHLLPEVLTYYRIRRNSLSRNKFRKAFQQWRIYRRLEKIPLLPAIKYFISYATNALTR